MKTSLKAATQTLVDRQTRRTHPDGKFDSAMRWFPSDSEWQACCARIRYPSRAYPYSLLVHCRTATHVATLLGVNEAKLKRSWNRTKKITQEVTA